MELTLPQEQETSTIVPGRQEFSIIYEDEDLMVINKPVSYTHLDVYKRQVWSNQYGSWLHTGKDGDDLNNRLSTVEN